MHAGLTCSLASVAPEAVEMILGARLHLCRQTTAPAPVCAATIS